jgi:hypothetical protein
MMMKRKTKQEKKRKLQKSICKKRKDFGKTKKEEN